MLAGWEREYSLFSLERNKGYSLLSPYTTSKPWFKNKEDLFNRIETKIMNRILSGQAFDKFTHTDISHIFIYLFHFANGIPLLAT